MANRVDVQEGEIKNDDQVPSLNSWVQGGTLTTEKQKGKRTKWLGLNMLTKQVRRIKKSSQRISVDGLKT